MTSYTIASLKERESSYVGVPYLGSLNLFSSPVKLIKISDILEGEFNNGVVTNAKLMFSKRKGYYEKCIFRGTVEYKINGDGESITYKMLEGELVDADKRRYNITSTYPLVVNCTLFPDHRDLHTEEFQTIIGTESISKAGELLKPLAPSSIGGVKSVYKIGSYKLRNDYIVQDVSRQEGGCFNIEFTNGTKAEVYNDSVSIMKKNEYTNVSDEVYDDAKESYNIYSYKRISGKIICFKSAFKDGFLEYSAQAEPNMKGYIQYSGGDEYKGSFFANSLYYESHADLYHRIMQERSLERLQLKIRTGVLKRQGEEVRYSEGMEHEQYLAKLQREKERMEKFSPVGKWDAGEGVDAVGDVTTSQKIYKPNGTIDYIVVKKGMKSIVSGYTVEYDLYYKDQNCIKWKKEGDTITEYVQSDCVVEAKVINLRLEGFTKAQKNAIRAKIPWMNREYTKQMKESYREQWGYGGKEGVKILYKITEFDDNHITFDNGTVLKRIK